MSERIERASDAADKKTARALYDALCRAVVLDHFAKTLAKDEKNPLTFAGQFASLKPFGKHAAHGAVEILKDPTTSRQFRNWAGDAIADIGDKSVAAELKAIADDFLYEDEDQESAAFALAALGDLSEIEKRIATLKDELRRTGSLNVQLQIARVHYRARQYPVAITIYRDILKRFRANIAARKNEFEPEQLASYRAWQAGWLYSLACNQSLAGNPTDALKSLDECARIDTKGQYVRMILRDGDLTNVRKQKTFAAWHRKAAAAAASKPAKEPAKEAGKASEPSPASPKPPAGQKKKAQKKKAQLKKTHAPRLAAPEVAGAIGG